MKKNERYSNEIKLFLINMHRPAKMQYFNKSFLIPAENFKLLRPNPELLSAEVIIIDKYIPIFILQPWLHLISKLTFRLEYFIFEFINRVNN